MLLNLSDLEQYSTQSFTGRQSKFLACTSRLPLAVVSWVASASIIGDSCLQHLIGSGAKSIACIGICWGGWAMAHIVSDPEMASHFVCAASPHPSIHLENIVYGGETLNLMKAVKCPTLLMPAMGDPDDYRSGLPEQQHGLIFINPLFRRLVAGSTSRGLCNV